MAAPAATATARPSSPRRTRGLRSHPRARQQPTDADVYSGIARVWWSMLRAGEHHDHLMRPFLVRPGFAAEVWDRPDINPQDVLAVCARIVVLEDFQLTEYARLTQMCQELTEALDPLRSWWLPLTNTPEMGIHFWQLVLVPVELRCIGPVDDPPSLQCGRFPKRSVRGGLRADPCLTR